MSEGRTLLLGAIAGMTILLGLPIARLPHPLPRLRQFLNAIAIGILIFLLWDVLSHAYDPLDAALNRLHNHTAGAWPVIGYAALFLGGIGIGLFSMVVYERWLARRRRQKAAPVGPGAMTALDRGHHPRGIAHWSAARHLALLIAVGIGLHNFAEGLAIGQSAAQGEVALATLLVIGFALHNATEGFGIAAPLAAERERPTWAFLFMMGLIGGGPTFFGTLVGRQFTSPEVSVLFLTLAAGSILFVVIQLLEVGFKARRRDVLLLGVFLGLVAGFITDMVVSAGGA